MITSKSYCQGFCTLCGTGSAEYASEIHAMRAENASLREALELIAAPMRPDGTWNRDRQACGDLARAALSHHES